MTTVRGHRQRPISRAEEYLALRNAERSLAAGTRQHEEEVARGTILVRPGTGRVVRLALRNRSGQRVVAGYASGMDGNLTLARALAAALHQAPKGLTWDAPAFGPEGVGHVMQMRRNQRCPQPRADGSIRLGVPGGAAVVDRHSITATTDTGVRVRFALEGLWTTFGVARVADAMLRDLAPEAHHLTYTTEPRGWHLNGTFVSKRGGGRYDGASTAYCSCGWFCMEGDRASARWSAAWHRENPSAYRPA
ncbi:hypothetical protein [Actinomadura sp. 3N508]|uniref:hypothetical protein n=1 Tax=Actinomadura sp. 3N508 TaxID=3375153 RepID=UPI00379A3BC7